MFKPIVRSSFLGEFDDIFSQVANARGRISVSSNQTVPRANVSKDKEGYQISIAAPGLSRSDFGIEVSDSILTVSSKNSYKNENSLRQEYSYHDFSRSWSLPEDTNIEGITADYNAGILNLNIPVDDVIISKTKKIEVN